MNAKVYKDGNRVIISFEGFQQQNEAEEFLKRVMEIVSGPVPFAPEMVSDLDPIVDDPDYQAEEMEQITLLDHSSGVAEEVVEELFASESESNEMKEPEITDFPEPFAGKTVKEIVSTPKFEGFYFLCERVLFAEVPERYRVEVAKALLDTISASKILEPPYGNVERMKRYCQMGQKMLGKTRIPDDCFASNDADVLDLASQRVCELIQAFCDDRLQKYLT